MNFFILTITNAGIKKLKLLEKLLQDSMVIYTRGLNFLLKLKITIYPCLRRI